MRWAEVAAALLVLRLLVGLVRQLRASGSCKRYGSPLAQLISRKLQREIVRRAHRRCGGKRSVSTGVVSNKAHMMTDAQPFVDGYLDKRALNPPTNILFVQLEE